MPILDGGKQSRLKYFTDSGDIRWYKYDAYMNESLGHVKVDMKRRLVLS